MQELQERIERELAIRERTKLPYYQHTGWESLTKRELEVCFLIGQGFSNVTIAEILGLGDRAIEHYIHFCYSKLDIKPLNIRGRYHNRALLVAMVRANDSPLGRHMPPAMMERLEEMVAAYLESKSEGA